MSSAEAAIAKIAAAPPPANISGKAVDGYIAFAHVFADANGNGIQDPGEASATTDADGDFNLTGASGTIILSGGTDVSTGLALKGILKAPPGSTVVSPITSLIESLVSSGSSIAAAVQPGCLLKETVMSTREPLPPSEEARIHHMSVMEQEHHVPGGASPWSGWVTCSLEIGC